MSPFRITAAATLLTSRVFRVERRTIEGTSGAFHRDVVVHPGAVAILARNAEGRVGVVRQYRATVDRVTTEIPAGTLDREGEEPQAAAERELGEELGVTARHWRLLARLLVSPGWTNQVMHVFEATGIEETARDPAGPEEAASSVAWVEPNELFALVRSGEPVDATLTVALHRLAGDLFPDA